MLKTLIFSVVLTAVVVSSQFSWPAEDMEKQRWFDYSKKKIDESLKRKLNGNLAKNVIMFLGDGMGPSTVTTGRIMVGQLQQKSGEETITNIDKMEHLALSKTYNIDAQTADSAGTATAYLSGVKTRIGAIGVDGHAVDCRTTLTSEVDSILQWAHYAGKSTGIVTNTRITHATPSGAYAHVYERDFEAYDIYYPPNDAQLGCRDIADQLVTRHDYINVIFGGGLRKFIRSGVDTGYLISGCRGDRIDNRNLIEEWKTKMKNANRRHTLMTNRSQLMVLTGSEYDHYFGLFACDHIDFEDVRNHEVQPSLSEMVEKAIQILSKNPKGYFLFVEGGRIDHAHHDSTAKRALNEFVEFDKAIGNALKMVSLEDTHVTVTADHSHVFTIGGYAKRGNPLFGINIGNEDAYTTNGTTYTALLYGNGPGALFSIRTGNLTSAETDQFTYKQEAAVHIYSETHGGEDVGIYSSGPMSYLFDGTVEQSHIAHVLAYSACIGPYNQTNDPNCRTNRGILFNSAHKLSINIFYLITSAILTGVIFF